MLKKSGHPVDNKTNSLINSELERFALLLQVFLSQMLHEVYWDVCFIGNT